MNPLVETGMDPVAAFLLHDSIEPRVHDVYDTTKWHRTPRRAPKMQNVYDHSEDDYQRKWDPTTPPEWAGPCWGTLEHDWLDCMVCQTQYETWLLLDAPDDCVCGDMPPGGRWPIGEEPPHGCPQHDPNREETTETTIN